MVKFKISEHKLEPGVQVIEVKEGEKYLCTIYPTEDGIKIVSKRFKEIKEEPVPYPPAIYIDFE